MILIIGGLALYWPTLSLDFHLLDEPGDTVYSFRMVEQMEQHPSIMALRAEKDPYRLTPIHYLYHYTMSRVLGISGPRHHAAHVCFLLIHLLLLVWLFRALTGSGWWAVLAGFFYLLFIPDDWNSTPYNFYTLFTLEPLVIAFLGTWCGLGSWLALHRGEGKSSAWRNVATLALFPLALLILFTKETAVFYVPGVAVLCLVLWRGSRNWRVPVAMLVAYAVASLAFLACFFYVTGWRPGVTAEVMPGAGPGQRLSHIVHAFGDTFGPLPLLVPAAYVLWLWQRGKHLWDRDGLFEVDFVALALMLPSLVQLVIWPNFQIRLLLPHGLLLSILITMAVWRIALVALKAGNKVTRVVAGGALAIGAGCAVVFAVFASMALHNFRLLLRGNELCRVEAYKKCRDLLEPESRLFVAIQRSDQIFSEIAWRLQFFDHKSNAVIELQPGSEQPKPGDVIYYHKRMARVKLPQLSMDAYEFREHGYAFLNVGWSKWLSALETGKPFFESAEGGNEYYVFKVRKP